MWTVDGVVTVTKKAVVSGNVSYVTCNMTTMGYLALFEGPAVIEGMCYRYMEKLIFILHFSKPFRFFKTLVLAIS